MITIGIDPHKGSHTATAIDDDEAVVGELRVDADRHQRVRLLAWVIRPGSTGGSDLARRLSYACTQEVRPGDP